MGGQYSMDILSGDEAALMSDRISVFSGVPGGDTVIPGVKKLQTAIGTSADGNYGPKTDTALRALVKNNPALKSLTNAAPITIIGALGGKINGVTFSASDLSQIGTAFNAWKAKPATPPAGDGGGGTGTGGGGGGTDYAPPPELDESGFTGWLQYWWIPVAAIGLFAVVKLAPKLLKKKEGLSTVSGCDCGR